jgi:hypothetical protein
LDRVEKVGRDAWAAAVGSRWLRHPDEGGGAESAWRFVGARVRPSGAGEVPTGGARALGSAAVDFGPVAFEVALGGGDAAGGDAGGVGGFWGPALCSDAVGAGCPSGRGDPARAGAEAESLILAQNERWRRA